jgi:hypothetical protein
MLFTRARSTSRRLTIGDALASKTASGAASNTALAVPEGSLRRSMRTSSQVVSTPSTRAMTPFASVSSSLIRTSEPNSTPSSLAASSISVRPT